VVSFAFAVAVVEERGGARCCRAAEFTPQGLSSTLWSLSKIPLPVSLPECEEVVDTCMEQALSVASDLAAVDVCNILVGPAGLSCVRSSCPVLQAAVVLRISSDRKRDRSAAWRCGQLPLRLR